MSRLNDAAKQIAVQRFFTGNSGKPFGKVPVPRTPSRVETEYVGYLRKITKAMKILTGSLLDEYLPRITISYNEEVRRDSWVDDLESLRTELVNGFGNILDAGGMTQKVTDISTSVNQFNFIDFQRMTKSVFGVELFSQEPWKDNLLKSWANDNASLITNMSKQSAEDVYQAVQRGVKAGTRNSQIKTFVLSDLKLTAKNSGQDITSVSVMRKLRNRADLIAVDQVGKLNGQLTENRQQDIGVDSYFWRNVGDERVRGNPAGLYSSAKYDHWDREGEEFKWSNPPQDGHPGQPIRCRCSAEANLDKLIAEIETIEES
jgi:SPP1 gp7 family putative phage head morphogenesis protein